MPLQPWMELISVDDHLTEHPKVSSKMTSAWTHDQITWECDHPHSDSFWPQSGDRAAQALQKVSDDEVHRMVELNARHFYNFPRVA